MISNNNVASNEWAQIGFGGTGKAHYSAYLKEIEDKDKRITAGRLVYRASTLMMAEVKIFSLGEKYLSADEMRDLLLKYMSYSGKSFEEKKDMAIGGCVFKLLIKGEVSNVISELFTTTRSTHSEEIDIEEINAKLG